MSRQGTGTEQCSIIADDSRSKQVNSVRVTTSGVMRQRGPSEAIDTLDADRLASAGVPIVFQSASPPAAEAEPRFASVDRIRQGYCYPPRAVPKNVPGPLLLGTALPSSGCCQNKSVKKWPVVDRPRALQQVSEWDKVQKRFPLSWASIGSLSEASRVFDAALLQPIIAERGDQPQPLARDPRRVAVPHPLTLVDGTLRLALPQWIQAPLLKRQTDSGQVKWRLHAQFEVERGPPTRIDVTPNGGGKQDARAVLKRTREPDRRNGMDRG